MVKIFFQLGWPEVLVMFFHTFTLLMMMQNTLWTMRLLYSLKFFLLFQDGQPWGLTFWIETHFFLSPTQMIFIFFLIFSLINYILASIIFLHNYLHDKSHILKLVSSMHNIIIDTIAENELVLDNIKISVKK